MTDQALNTTPTRIGLAVSGVMLVIFLFAIDSTIVSAAMPTIVGKLGGLELYSWVFSVYMLTSALATAICGKLSDLYGRRRVMLIGIGLFMLGSALSGAAQRMEHLILFRAVQGVGGGAICALSFIVTGFLFPPEKRPQAMGWISSIWGIASVLGPLAGGLITQYWNWRWIFFVNLPICFTAIFLISSGLTEGDQRSQGRPDLKGAATLLVGILLLFYSLEEIRTSVSLLDPTVIALMAAASAAFALCYRVERRAEEPILPPGLFRLALFRTCTVLGWLSSMGIMGVISFLPLYIQGVQGRSATQAGLALMLASLGWTAGTLIGGQGIGRFGYRAPSLAGTSLMALGYALFVSGAHLFGLVAVLAIGCLIGIGMGIVNVASMVAAQNSVPMSDLGVATSTTMLFRMFGGAFGISLMGSVLFRQMHQSFARLSASSGATMSGDLIKRLADPQALLDPATRALIPQFLRNSLVEILSQSVWYAFLTGFLVTLLGISVSFFMVDRFSSGRSNRSA